MKKKERVIELFKKLRVYEMGMKVIKDMGRITIQKGRREKETAKRNWVK